MLPETAERLLKLNRRFYQSFAQPFAETRQRPQPGVLAVGERIPTSASVLDLGCGNGGLARVLAQRDHKGTYLGIDAEASLLAIARDGDVPHNAAWLQLDLGLSGWWESLDQPYDVICAFAFLHHLPGSARRRAWAEAVRHLLASDGWIALSVWDFLALPDVEERLVPWEAADLSQEQVEPGDYLIDWRRGGSGIRYVHHFTSDELSELAESGGFRLADSFRSDGHGGKLGLYQLWVAADAKSAIL
jgi:SAM-dependent methyltransferase